MPMSNDRSGEVVKRLLMKVYYRLKGLGTSFGPLKCDNCGSGHIKQTHVRKKTTGQVKQSWQCTRCGERDVVRNDF